MIFVLLAVGLHSWVVEAQSPFLRDFLLGHCNALVLVHWWVESFGASRQAWECRVDMLSLTSGDSSAGVKEASQGAWVKKSSSGSKGLGLGFRVSGLGLRV